MRGVVEVMLATDKILVRTHPHDVAHDWQLGWPGQQWQHPPPLHSGSCSWVLVRTAVVVLQPTHFLQTLHTTSGPDTVHRAATLRKQK